MVSEKTNELARRIPRVCAVLAQESFEAADVLAAASADLDSSESVVAALRARVDQLDCTSACGECKACHLFEAKGHRDDLLALLRKAVFVISRLRGNEDWESRAVEDEAVELIAELEGR